MLTEDLALEIASFLPANDLLRFQCVSSSFSGLDTDVKWRNLCQWRWKPWPRYELTPERLNNLNTCTTWKEHYRRVESDATRTKIKKSDLLDLRWFITFRLSGVRGETRSNPQRSTFSPDGLLVPGYPALSYEIIDEAPPSPAHIHKSQMGDQPFSTEQWLKITDFPPHYITKSLSNAEWIISNANVILVSCK